MFTIPIITTDSGIASDIGKMIIKGLGKSDSSGLVNIKSYSEAIDYLNMEMPDLACIDFSCTQTQPHRLLETINGDPWLLHAGIIAFCRTADEEQLLSDMKNSNIINVILYSEIHELLPKIMGIISLNRQILFQRVIGIDIPSNISASIQLDNDLHAASCYANLLANYLYTTNKIDRDCKGTFSVAMHELLANAIEHGNCEISYDEKTEILDSGKNIQDLIKKTL